MLAAIGTALSVGEVTGTGGAAEQPSELCLHYGEALGQPLALSHQRRVWGARWRRRFFFAQR